MGELCISTQKSGDHYLWFFAERQRQAVTSKQSLVLYGQATKRTRWMPRQLEAMKDVGACEKVRGAGKHALILTCPNGETHLP